MNFGPKSFALCACLCISSVLAAAQGTTCAADGEAPAQGSPIACVTGDGVQVTGNPTAAPAPEILPLTPEQRPAAAPVVSYVDGKLTVVAKNSTLGDVLRAIAAKTGASIDIPESANERIVSQLGPAPARDVMASLLNGSHYNYVMVGTETNPNSVAHVILTAKSERPEGSAATTASRARPMVQPRSALQAAVMQPYQEMLQQQQAQQAAAAEFQQQAPEIVPETPVPATSEPAAGASATGGSSATGGGSPENAPVEAAPAGGTPRAGNGSGEKTPQQVLQDLYETRRQMMQQQHQPPPQTPPQ